MSKIDQVAQTGFVNADKYDQWRPSYPEEAVDALLTNLGVKDVHGARVVDVGAGTGIFTAILAARHEQFEIIAVEPHDSMRGVLEAKNLPRVKVMKGTADAMPLVEKDWAHAVVAAQAFHWFATKETLQEMHRVLKPRGKAGFVWNREDFGTSPDSDCSTRWESKLKDIVWGRGNTEPRRRHLNWRKVFDEQVKLTPTSAILGSDPLFSLPIGEQSFGWTSWLKPDEVWNRLSTQSHLAVLPEEELKEIKQIVYDAFKDDAEYNDKGQIAVHGHTSITWSTAIPSEPIGDLDSAT